MNNSISLQKNKQQMIQFNNDGEGFQLQVISSSKLLFLSGEPINEKDSYLWSLCDEYTN